MIWDPIDIAWVAGIIEGEGCILITKYKTVTIKVSMTDEDVIESLYEKFKIGRITTRKSVHSNWKQVWNWSVAKQRDVARFLLAITPLLYSRRRERISEAVELLHQRFELKICTNCGKKYQSDYRSTRFCRDKECIKKRSNLRQQKTTRTKQRIERGMDY